MLKQMMETHLIFIHGLRRVACSELSAGGSSLDGLGPAHGAGNPGANLLGMAATACHGVMRPDQMCGQG